jgi:hypothetical protein
MGGPAPGPAGRGGHRRLMPVSEFHGHVAAVALRAAAPHGFALGGGNALIAHGIIDRFTQDVDVFSDEQGGVRPLPMRSRPRWAKRASGPSAGTRPVVSLTSSTGWAKGWLSGSSPGQTGIR